MVKYVNPLFFYELFLLEKDFCIFLQKSFKSFEEHS